MNREKVRKTERGGGFLSSRERRLAGQGRNRSGLILPHFKFSIITALLCFRLISVYLLRSSKMLNQLFIVIC